MNRPSNCFGRQHLNGILKTHQDAQNFLFDGQNDNGKSVTEHLKQMISSRFNVSDIPDAFLYMPEALGGLGLRNPFIPLFLVSRDVCDDPKDLIRDFLEVEKNAYDEAKRNFENLSEQERRAQFRCAFPKDEETGSRLYAPSREDAKIFPSLEKMTQYRLKRSMRLQRVYRELTGAASVERLELSRDVDQQLRTLYAAPTNLSELHPASIDPEIGWLIQFYAKELEEKCGGLSIVDRAFLPLGVLKAMRKKKVAWQMAL